jgi:hypothetical protein
MCWKNGDLITNKEKYRKRIRKLQMSIRPIGNKKSTNSPDYDQIQNTDLYRSLIPYNTNENGINWEEKHNHNHNYSDFIHDLNMIDPQNPPRQVHHSFSFLDDNLRNNYIKHPIHFFIKNNNNKSIK